MEKKFPRNFWSASLRSTFFPFICLSEILFVSWNNVSTSRIAFISTRAQSSYFKPEGTVFYDQGVASDLSATISLLKDVNSFITFSKVLSGKEIQNVSPGHLKRLFWWLQNCWSRPTWLHGNTFNIQETCPLLNTHIDKFTNMGNSVKIKIIKSCFTTKSRRSTNIFRYKSTHTRTHTYIEAPTHTYMHSHTHTYIYKSTQTHAYSHTHTYIYI